MPQVTAAERFGWPDEYTGEGMATTREFIGPVGNQQVGAPTDRSL
jgi:hypothetical protein